MGCNAFLGNDNFTGPPAGGDCMSRGLPPTTLSGTVFAPNQSLPIYNAMVYVPTTKLADIPDGPSGPTCASGSPAVMTFSNSHGNFKLDNPPVGTGVRLVIQVGKWRREVTIPSVAECADTSVDAGLTHLPRDSTEGHIPHIAITSGIDDTLECVAHDIGISDAEVTSGPSSMGRVRLYAGRGGVKQFDSGALVERSDVLVNAATIQQYDVIMYGCEGGLSSPAETNPSALLDFTNRGGWLWLTHFQFQLLEHAPPPWNTIATFNPNFTIPPGTTILIDDHSPHGQALADWSVATGASAMPGTLMLDYSRSSCTAADPATTRIMYLDPASGPAGVQMFAWDAAMGGRMVFSDVHLNGGKPLSYPSECPAAGSPQEKAIMFEMFDTPTCVN